ncbi:cysteine desulfurase family protein [cf. Phormidesmis sp. LEGE 11477]|uniref:cysteine desulfurase family protein n=1 Tax=cf. Phormidesmis sp. LEGE 11477 TaxID=1828680 RepID=UPI0018801F4A|nr:IscS subfamily cysteine desulfurase [cf. Phormidesmis sp. LEGE 11477]MBE9064346.1 IscS subfamily cysteine desulfurase [cf. Phormidesmis sp. LEGE 11477]
MNQPSIIRPVYLDCNATTPVDPRVLSAMLPFFTDYFGNPSSLNHSYGWEAEAGVQQSREILAAAIAADPVEIIFTSGATEANNLAIKGIAESYMGEGRHLITVQTEHSAVLEPCRYLETLGFEVTYLPVQPDGLIELETLENAFRPDTILVSVMAANNEIGVLQPLEKIGEMCRDRHVLFHTDAAQALGKIPLNVQKMHIDLLSMTAHKLYGPKGIGALYVRRKNPRVQISPQLHGGGQERGIRSGTLYPPQIVGFGEAVRLAVAEMETESERLIALRDRLWQQLSLLPGVQLNGHPTQRLPNNLSISINSVEGSTLLAALQPDIAISSGSACSTEKLASSHVIGALGLRDRLARATLRFGLGRATTRSDINKAIKLVRNSIRMLQEKPIDF